MENRDHHALSVARPEPKVMGRDIVRRWLRDPTGSALDMFGTSAIRASADATFQLTALASGESAQGIFADVERIAAAWEAPGPPPRFSWLPGRRPSTGTPTADAISAVAARLDAELDESTRRTILLTSSRDRLARADEGLKQALATVRSMGPMIDAAARELRVEQPESAATMQARGSTILLEREQALLTQQAIHHQAITTLDLMIANHKVLDRAIVQSRTATLSALEVAIAARQVVREQASTDPGPAAKRAREKLRGALAEARQALSALETNGQAASRLDSRSSNEVCFHSHGGDELKR